MYIYNFYGADLYVNVYRGVFTTQSNICSGGSLRKSQIRYNHTVDIPLGSKYASGMSFTAEKVYRMLLLV